MATKLNQVLPALVWDDAFVLTPSDTLDVSADPNNTADNYSWVYVKNSTNAGGSVKVTTVHGKDVTVFIPAGGVETLAVKRVWSTPTPPATLLGYVSHQKV